tara:strand:- start:72 stop:368 length:297 start_codon:yes stop_codon:yes gene_type:complete
MPRYKLVNGERIQLTAEEEAQKDAEEQAWLASRPSEFDMAMEDLRAKRNNLLAETDYYALSDQTLSDDMKTYRQDLRDITNGLTTVEQVQAVEFPTKP